MDTLKAGFKKVEIKFLQSKKRKNEVIQFLILNQDMIKKYSRKKDCIVLNIFN